MSIIHRILDLFIFIGDEEEQIELLKFQAFKLKNLTSMVAFMRIDQQQKGFIKACDIQDFLFSNGYQSNGDASLKYICHYDIDQDEQLSLKEFERALLPQSPQSALLKSEILRRPPYNVIQKLPIKIEESLFKIIKKQIEFYHKLLTKLTMIWVDFKLDLGQIFQFIDKDKQGYMSTGTLVTFFEDFGYNLYRDQIQFIMQAFDIKLNGTITLREFSHLLYISTEQAEDILIAQQSLQEIKSASSHKQSVQNKTDRESNKTDRDQNRTDHVINKQERLNNQSIVSAVEGQEKRNDSFLNTTIASRKRIISLNKSNYQPSNISTSFQFHLNETFSNAKKRSVSSVKSCLKKQDGYVKIINKDLVQVLKFLIEYSKRMQNLDKLKQQLLSQSDIDVTIIFSLFDREQRGYLGRDNFTEGMYDIGLVPNNVELMLLFRRFRLEQDILQITFAEFADIISPMEQHLIPDIYQKFETYTQQTFSFLSYTTQTLLRDYFSTEIQNQIYKSQFIQSISKTHFLERDLVNILSKIQTTNNEIITLKEIEKSMKLNSLNYESKSLKLLVCMINQKQLDELQRYQTPPNFVYTYLQNIVDEILYD